MKFIYNDPGYKMLRKKLRNEMTPQEVLLWNKLKNSQLGHKFRRQESIGKYIADFYCPRLKLVIEIDGSQHLDNALYDFERDRYFKNLGLIVLRFWNNEINTNISGVIKKVCEIINTTPPKGTPPNLGGE